MKNKSLFFDIDGTLIAGGLPGYIPDSTVDALERARLNGHYLFINTGRTYGFIPKPIKKLPFDGFVCGCGTEIIFHDKVLYHHTVPDETKLKIRTYLKRANVQVAYEGHDKCYFETGRDMLPAIREIRNDYIRAGGKKSILPLDAGSPDYNKFFIVGNEDSNFPLFKELISMDFDYIQREKMYGCDFAEIVPKGCSKASGIDLLTEYLGLSLGDCYAFGDSTNDLSMLCHVGYSVGMGNAKPEVLEQVTYITDSVDQDGIWNAMKYFMLI